MGSTGTISTAGTSGIVFFYSNVGSNTITLGRATRGQYLPDGERHSGVQSAAKIS